MKFWNDDLRICPKCKTKVELSDEPQAKCSSCRTRVWFFHYRKLKTPPRVPELTPQGLRDNPTTTLLLVAAGLLAFVALAGITKGALVATVCSLAAIGFAMFGFLRHAETHEIEQKLAQASELQAYADTMHKRVNELTQRYIALLRTGDTRIEHYYSEIYDQAEREKNEAEYLRAQALEDREAVASVESRIYAVAEKHIQDHTKWVSQKLRADPENYLRNKTQLSKAFDFVENVGYPLPKVIRTEALATLKANYAQKTREQILKDEQRRIKAQIREEERARREHDQAIREAEQQERLLQQELEAALREHKDAHSSEIEELQRQLAEAQASSEKAKSMAQLTKVGHVYVLSNIGSFGPDVFKVGMTRRVDPNLRVKELSDASVPFPFDVHAMFSCENAPALENDLHRELTRYRVNRVNLRKEYFNVELSTVLTAVGKHHGKVEYVAEPEALEYRETQEIRPEDLIEHEAELAELGIGIDSEDDE